MNDTIAALMVVGNQQVDQLLLLTFSELRELVEPVMKARENYMPRGIL